MLCTQLICKMLGVIHAEMLALKSNDAGEYVCLLWCDGKSRVACKAVPPLFFLSFGTRLSLFFFFFLFTMFLAFSVFLFTRTNVQLKSYNLNRFANLHGTRCHPFNSFLRQPGVILSAWLSFFLQHVGQHRSKNYHDEEIKSQIFYWSCYMCCCERHDNQREERFKRWWKRRIHGIFLLSSRLQHWVLFHFFHVLLT